MVVEGTSKLQAGAAQEGAAARVGPSGIPQRLGTLTRGFQKLMTGLPRYHLESQWAIIPGYFQSIMGYFGA